MLLTYHSCDETCIPYGLFRLIRKWAKVESVSLIFFFLVRSLCCCHSPREKCLLAALRSLYIQMYNCSHSICSSLSFFILSVHVRSTCGPGFFFHYTCCEHHNRTPGSSRCLGRSGFCAGSASVVTWPMVRLEEE